MSQHTPGPWNAPSAGIYGSDRNLVATINVAPLRGVDESQANARLIAAAPELLALLEEGLRLAKTDYGKIGEERACNADYLAKVERSNWYMRSAAVVARAKGGAR